MDYSHFKCTSHMVTPMTPSYDEQQMPVAAPISQSTSEESTTSTASSSASSSAPVAAAAATIRITGQQQLDNIEYRYHIQPRIIGRGHQGSVHECIDRTTGERYAVKSIRKSDPAVERSQLSCEIELLREMDHPGIVRLVDVFEDDEYVHLVTDLYEGGELFDKIVEKSSSNDDNDDDNDNDNNADSVCFAEDEAARIMHQLLAAVSYMHERDVVHRDIKAENILFETEHEHSPVRIIDFGLSRKHRSSSGGCCRRQRQRRRQRQQQQQQRPMTKAVGTPYYIAPEVLMRRYDRSCDIWSLGVIAYVLLCGYPPFNGETDDETHRSILRGTYGFPPEEWSGVSSEARDFIDGMLRMDPRERMTAEEALVHPWIARHHHRHHLRHHRHHLHRVVVASERMMMVEEECHDSCVEVVYRESIGKQNRSQSRGGSTTRKDGMSVFGFR